MPHHLRLRLDRYGCRSFLGASLLLLVSLAIAVPPAAAQSGSVSDALASLLLDQRVPTPADPHDQQAALTTLSTLAQLVTVDLSTLPASSSAGGFVYRINPELGTMERASSSFGAFFTERAQRIGANQLSLGIAYRYAEFSSLQGASLTDGTFPSGASRLVGSTQPYALDLLTLQLNTKTVTGFATYGVTDRLDVGATVPIVSVNFSGTRINSQQQSGQSTLQSSVFDSASGFGDVALRARYRVAETSHSGFAVGTDVRVPTGRSQDLLGSGETAMRLLAIESFESSVVGGHVNLGYTFGGLSREFSYSGAMTYAASPRVTLVGEVMGRYLSDLHVLRDVYLPHDSVTNVETMRWVPLSAGVNQALTAVGMKWNIAGGYVLNGNLLVSLTDSGLTARVVPSITLDYTFSR